MAVNEMTKGFKADIEAETHWAQLSDNELQSMHLAASSLEHWQDVLRKTGDTVVTELLRGVEKLDFDAVYPEDTVQDFESFSQYYFHTHMERSNEYGHIHTYAMSQALPEWADCLEPAMLGDHEDPSRTHCHLVAISVDNAGNPTKLFTINHWSAHEARYDLNVMRHMLNAFDVGHAVPSYPVNRWVSAILRLFNPQIMKLFADREKALSELQQQEPGISAAQNESMDVTSQTDVSMEKQIRCIKTEIDRRELTPCLSPEYPAL